jgi:hypothetical protein
MTMCPVPGASGELGSGGFGLGLKREGRPCRGWTRRLGVGIYAVLEGRRGCFGFIFNVQRMYMQ